MSTSAWVTFVEAVLIGQDGVGCGVQKRLELVLLGEASLELLNQRAR
jgi:hypothetical protein